MNWRKRENRVLVALAFALVFAGVLWGLGVV